MAVSIYLPKDIESVAAKVVAQNSTISPNYIAEKESSPSVLKRNLVAATANTVYDFNVVPLKLPTTHSTGAVLKARSFDYDFVITNNIEIDPQPVFVMDVGFYSFKTLFTGKAVVAEDTTFTYSILGHNIEDTLTPIKTMLDYKIGNLKKSSQKELGATIGKKVVGVIEALDIDTSNLYIVVDLVASTLKVSIETTLLTPTLTTELEGADLFVSKGDKDAYSKLRFAGAVTYQPTLGTFYPNTTVSQDIPNLRDYLSTQGFKDYLGFFFVLKYNEGMLFNLEVGTKNASDYTLNSVPDLFETSQIGIYQNIDDLLAQPSAFVGTTGGITKYEVFNSKITEEAVAIDSLTSTDQVAISALFKKYGIYSRIVKSGVNVTKLFLNRIENTRTEPLIYVRITSSKDITVIENTSLKDVLFTDLPGDNREYSYTPFGENDSTVDSYTFEINLSKPSVEETFAADYSSIKILKNIAVELQYDNADSLNYDTYKNTLKKTTFVSEKTTHLTSYGYETMLNTIGAEMTSKLGLTTKIDIDKGIVYFNNKSTLFNNVFLNLKYSNANADTINYEEDPYGSTYSLITEKANAIQNKSQAIVRLNKGTVSSLPTINSVCSMIIIDEADIENLNLQPYCYNVTGVKIEEQVSIKDVLPLVSNNLQSLLYSKTAPFFVELLPLYTDGGLVTTKFALVLNSVDIDSKVMKNLLVWTDKLKTGLTDGYSEQYKALVGYDKTVPVYESFQAVSNSSTLFAGEYVSMNVKDGVSNRYLTTASVSLPITESTFDIKVSNAFGMLETCSFTVATEDTLADIILLNTLTNIVITEVEGELVFKLAPSAQDSRLHIEVIKQTSGAALSTSRLCYEDSLAIHLILNKE